MHATDVASATNPLTSLSLTFLFFSAILYCCDERPDFLPNRFVISILKPSESIHMRRLKYNWMPIELLAIGAGPLLFIVVVATHNTVS